MLRENRRKEHVTLELHPDELEVSEVSNVIEKCC